MARKEPCKGKHTSPQTAGRQNMDLIKIKRLKGVREDGDRMNNKVNTIMKKGEANGKQYKGKWTEEEFRKSVHEFFEYCDEVELKPSAPLLRLWLNVRRSTIHEWRSHPERYTYKSDIVEQAFDVMEAHLQERAEKYPTASIFLLKTTHHHVETSKVDVVTNGKDVTNAENVAEKVAKLGLDK